MNVGELGNFISYAFAPASMVAPLGTVGFASSDVFARLTVGSVCTHCQLCFRSFDAWRTVSQGMCPLYSSALPLIRTQARSPGYAHRDNRRSNRGLVFEYV
jgi:hypothetical protein